MIRDLLAPSCPSGDQDGPEVIYVSVRWARYDLMAKLGEEAVGVIPVQHRQGGKTERIGRGQGAGRDQSAGDRTCSIDTIRICREGMYPRRSIKFDGERKAVFGIGTTDTVSSKGDREFAPGKKDDRPRTDLHVGLDAKRQLGMLTRHVAGFSFEIISKQTNFKTVFKALLQRTPLATQPP